MGQKTKITLGLASVVLLTILVVVFSLNKKNTQITPISQEQVDLKYDPVQTSMDDNIAKSPDITIEGMVIAITDKEIAISNNTPDPEIISINAKTPVVSISKDKKETILGLAAIVSGVKASVLFEINETTKKKEARTIYLLQ